jgi:hypothetical protein
MTTTTTKKDKLVHSSFGKRMASANKDRAELDPADYEQCCEYYVGPNEDIADAFGHENFPEDCTLTRDELYDCGHCGTSHYYGAIFRHKQTGEYINVGNVCASKFFCFHSRKSMLVAQAKRVSQERERAKNNRIKAEQYLETRSDLVEAFKVGHSIIKDIHDKLLKYGSISDKQADFVLKLAKEESEKEPEPEPQPIPTELDGGRSKFTGIILGYKETYSEEWGASWKMLFRDDRGFKLFGGVPSGLNGCQGEPVEFFARINISDKDPCFGFHSRPTRGKCLNPEVEGV